MPTLSEIFGKRKISLYQNESLDLDHYYQEPYQDNNDLTDDSYDMGDPFETNGNKQKNILILNLTGAVFQILLTLWMAPEEPIKLVIL